jgi:predicted DNA-binding ribbon-helix-helix protein
MATTTRMHQTTIRFDRQLWTKLEAEAGRRGVSGAQLARDATVARLARNDGQRYSTKG